MKLAVDLSSILWTCLRAGKDSAGFKVVTPAGKEKWINTAETAYESVVNSLVAALNELQLTPIDMIFVQEGLSSKAPRLAIDPNYKGNREDKANEEYLEFKKLRENICEVFRRLGVLRLVQDYAEGDDTLGWLAANTEEPLVIMTNDNDLSVLNGINAYGAEVVVRVNGVVGENKYGNFPFKYVTLYKALVGDSSDSISGIPGFGPKAWEQLETRFGVAGMDMLVGMIRKGSLDGLYEDALQDKFVRKIYDGAKDLIRSYKLANIYPDWVDTMNNPLQWFAGMVHGEVTDSRLVKWRAARRLVTADNWEAFKAWAEAGIRCRPWLALDIETSTGDESDDWQEAQGDADGVDVIGSELTGMSLTFGRNMNHTVYISVDHAETNNVNINDLRDWLEEICEKTGVELVIHNTMFEGPVLYQHWGEAWKDNGYGGFLPNWNDTRFCASYVDENDKLGLKRLSKKWLNYDQVDYNTTTTLQGVGLTGGKLRGEVKVIDVEAKYRAADEYDVACIGDIEVGESICTVQEVSHMEERRQYKMRELPAKHVFDYACDDTVTTAGIFNFCKSFMQLEHTYSVMKKVEIDASYLHAHAYVYGTAVDLPKLAELVAEDTHALNQAQAVLDAYLVTRGWEGTVRPVFGSAPLTVPDMKAAHMIVLGEPLETAVRTPAKAAHLVTNPRLWQAFDDALNGNFDMLNRLVEMNFTGRPSINLGSPKQLQKLMYETMQLPIKVYNPPTETMRKAGFKVGTPKTDNLAITYALLDADDSLKPVLEALRIIKMVNTRFGLFYEPLPKFVHWKTGLVHSSHNQCATNTRRASSSKPNLQQLSKNVKVEGFSPRVRELYIPHRKGAVIVSLDFSSQELVLMAEWSRDPALVSCFVGDNPTDMHSVTGVGVHNRMWGTEYSYDVFLDILGGEASAEQKNTKKSRALGKAVNFGSQYRIAAKKLSLMLQVTETEAQAMLDAKAEAFPIVEQWSLDEMEAIKGTGKVRTMLGAVRHLREQIMSSDRIIAGKAPRQVLSYRIQGSAAEQTKLSEGRMWSENLLRIYDCRYFGAVHDELVFSVAIEDLESFIPHAHRLMVADYAGMTMPIRSSCSVGYDFGQQVELNGDFSKANIYKALGLKLEEETL